MKDNITWQVKLGVVLIALSFSFYLLHYALFRDLHHIWLYLIGDIAFVFVEVLLVTMIIHELLAYREKKTLLKKLNMVIGAFFSEVGVDLIKEITAFTAGSEAVLKDLAALSGWTDKDFQKAAEKIQKAEFKTEAGRCDLVKLKNTLSDKRDFLLRLMENPNLLEHESFTNVLWGVFHLTEELCQRSDLKHLSLNDLAHLSGDIKRAYGWIVIEWLAYMRHLKNDYPYLFSLAVRTNPFDPGARAEVR